MQKLYTKFIETSESLTKRIQRKPKQNQTRTTSCQPSLCELQQNWVKQTNSSSTTMQDLMESRKHKSHCLIVSPQHPSAILHSVLLCGASPDNCQCRSLCSQLVVYKQTRKFSDNFSRTSKKVQKCTVKKSFLVSLWDFPFLLYMDFHFHFQKNVY